MSNKNFLKAFAEKRIMVIGDVMIDRYLTGSVSRISPEAPVPVVLHQQTDNRLGGAANVALNLRALGAAPILVAVAGTDDDGFLLKKMLPTEGIAADGLVQIEGRKTTVKTRVLAGNHQMLRIDSEDTKDLDAAAEAQVFEKIKTLLDENRVQAIIFQDYNKGLLTENLIQRTIEVARQRGILTTVDPKKKNFFAYRGVDFFKPNLKEIRDSVPIAVQPTAESLRSASEFLRERLENRLTMITLSEKGLFLEGDSLAGAGKIYPTKNRSVADVSGAGDTVISVATLCLVAGFDLETMANLSNLAGGQVCEFPGVVPVDPQLLESELLTI